MLRGIVKIANKLDSLGLTKEADMLDQFIRKLASDTDDDDHYDGDDYSNSINMEMDYDNKWSRQEELQKIEEPPPVPLKDLKAAIIGNLKKRFGYNSVDVTDITWGDYTESITSGLSCWRVKTELVDSKGITVSKNIPVARVTEDFNQDSFSVTDDGEAYYFFAFYTP